MSLENSSRSDQHRSSGLSFTQTSDELNGSSSAQQQELEGLRDNYGHIQSLTISNFKSYFGTTKIGPPIGDFTCIIGPNGSGKSNLMDAISFVLGIRTQQLRGKKLTDLIHRINYSQSQNNNNNSSQSQTQSQQPQKAYVELKYLSKKKIERKDQNEDDDEDDDIQNNNNNPPQFEEKIMIFRRTIDKDRTAAINQYKEYPADGGDDDDDDEVPFNQLSKKEYDEKLLNIGVIVSARNFLVFQGDVTNIAQKSGEQLTKWFEQISGSSQYRVEYEKAKENMEKLRVQFEAVSEKNRNLAREKKQMKSQKDEANSFQRMKLDLEEVKSEYFRYQLYHIYKDVKDAAENIEEVDQEIDEKNENLKELEDNIKLKQADLSKALRKKNNLTKNLKKSKQTLNKKKLKADGFEKKCEILKKDEGKLNKKIDSITENIEENDMKLNDLRQERNDIEEEKNKSEEKDEDIEFDENQMEIYNEIKEKICQETATLNLEKSALNDVFKRRNDEFETIRNEVNILEKREEKLDEMKDEINNNIKILEDDVKTIEGKYKEYQEEFGEKQENEKSLRNEQVVINDKLYKLHEELKEMDIGIRDNQKEKQQLEVLQTLQKLFSGMYGRLCDLIECRQQRFGLSVAVGLGINHDAVVVESKKVAIQCMEHMRKIRRGHFRFIPLNDIKTYPVQQELRRFGGTSQPMMDVINYEPQFERAVQFALSNTIVVDYIDEARDIAYNKIRRGNGNGKIRIVSIDGSVIQPNGNISGGFSKDFKDKARRFNDKERNKKIKVRDELLHELRQIEDELLGDDDEKTTEEMKQMMDNLENERKNKKLRIKSLKKQLEDKEKSLDELEETLKKKRNLRKKREKERDRAVKELEEKDEEIELKEEEIFEEVKEELGVDTIREYEDSKLKNYEQRQKEKKGFQVKLAEKNNKIEFIERKNKENKGEIKKLEGRLKKIRSDLKEIEDKKLKKIRKEIDKESKMIDKEEKKYDDIQDECKEKRKVVSDKKKEIDTKRKEINGKYQEKSKLNGWIAKLSQQQKNVIQQSKHEQISIESKSKQKRERRKQQQKKKKRKKAKGGHRRKRRKKNDGESSDEPESDDEDDEEEEEEEEESDEDDERKTDDEEELDEENGDDVDIVEIMEIRLRKSGIVLREFLKEFAPGNNNDGMDVDEDEDEEEQKDEDFMFEARKKEYEVKIGELSNQIQELQPNMKAFDQYKELQRKWKDGSSDQKQKKREFQRSQNEMEKIRDLRSKKLSVCFEIIKKNIKKIYGELTKSRQYKNGGKAFLDLSVISENNFDNFVIFNAMPPGKPFREMSQLSGGEKSVASLALLFAIHSFKQSPFFILDEIDAALDQKNVQKVCNFIKKKSKQNTQIIVISLKDKFFSNADSLIGVCKNRMDGKDYSKILSIDLTKYDKNNNNNKQRRRNQLQDDEKQQQ